MGTCKYDLIAVDLDGTLLDHDGHVSQRNIDALNAARAAGIVVTLCTGRAYVESSHAIASIGQKDPIIVGGGAMVVSPITGETIHRCAMDINLVHRVTNRLRDADHAVLLLKDAHVTDYEYLIIAPGGEESIDPSSRVWLQKVKARARYITDIKHDEHPEHTVRVGAYKANRPIDELFGEMKELFGHETSLHYFQGVVPERQSPGIDSVHVIEVFDPAADKWQAIQRLAKILNIPESRTAAIGDQGNDLSMITHAGLGVAMANAAGVILAAAKRRTLSCDESGVAYAVEKMLSGEW